jgi:hypothetical protein
MERSTAALVSLLLIPAVLQGGDFFKWMDPEGGVHYGDHPPMDAPCEELPAPPCLSDTELERARERARVQQELANELVQQRLRRQQEQRRIEAQRLSERREKCATARREFNWLQQTMGARIAVPDAEGNPHWISDRERLHLLESSRSEIDRWCD